MSVVIERDTGAQLLPEVRAERSVLTGWTAFVACDADMRAKHKEWRDIAARLEVRDG